FISRLIGIARTHDLLTESHWEGASLEAVLRNELSPHQTEGQQRILMRGDDVHLSPKVAVALGMVLHEMTTNAAKYGALSAPGGRIEIAWELRRDAAGPVLVLRWIEAGGPRVEPPKRQGFGSRLIDQSLTRDLGGRIAWEHRPEGLRCTFEIPLGTPAHSAEAA
ncbi:MAG: sensor histidine kinase, partial [Variibacter sp.]|nr:sensor histidine kinase [Variibacter sp.]